MLKYTLNGNISHHIKEIQFPGGEVGVGLNSEVPMGWDHPKVTEIKIDAWLATNDDIIKLMLLVDALRREYIGARLIARIPYMMYARQDRVCNRGEANSAVVMANIINSLGFDEVTVLDPHSDVIPALIHNIRIINQIDIFKRAHSNWSGIHIVAPDAGAYKKATAFAKAVGAAGVIVCNKERNLVNGHVVRIDMSADVTGMRLFVLDDICDGGRTFTELAKLLTKAVRTELAVTHGLFTKGIDVVANEFDRVYTTTSFKGVVPEKSPTNVVYYVW